MSHSNLRWHVWEQLLIDIPGTRNIFNVLCLSASYNRRHLGYIFSYSFTIKTHCSIWPCNKSTLWINQISLSGSHMIKVFDEFLWRHFHNSTKSFHCKKKYVISYLILVGRQIGMQMQNEKKIKERKQTEILVIIELLMKSMIRKHEKGHFFMDIWLKYRNFFHDRKSLHSLFEFT